MNEIKFQKKQIVRRCALSNGIFWTKITLSSNLLLWRILGLKIYRQRFWRNRLSFLCFYSSHTQSTSQCVRVVLKATKKQQTTFTFLFTVSISPMPLSQYNTERIIIIEFVIGNVIGWKSTMIWIMIVINPWCRRNCVVIHSWFSTNNIS